MLILTPRNLSLSKRIFFLFSLILASFFIFGLILILIKKNPILIYKTIFSSTFRDFYSFSEVLVKSTPLMLTGFSVLIAIRINLWNIGAEGQLVVGAILSSIFSLYLTNYFPDCLHLPLALLMSLVGGAIWAFFPIILKLKWKINEIISSLLLNYVAIILMEHLYFGPLRDPMGFGFPGTAIFPQSVWLPRLWQTRISMAFFLVLFLIIIFYLFLEKTPWGYKVKVIGENPNAAHYAHFPQKKLLFFLFLLSGSIAGLAGGEEVLGIHRRLQQGLAVGYGYDGIIVAFLAQKNPLLISIVSIFLSILKVGAEEVQSIFHLSASFTQILEGFILLSFLMAKTISEFKLSWVKK